MKREKAEMLKGRGINDGGLQERKEAGKRAARSARTLKRSRCGYIVVRFRIVSIAIPAPTWNPVLFSVRSVRCVIACPVVRVDSHQRFRASSKVTLLTVVSTPLQEMGHLAQLGWSGCGCDNVHLGGKLASSLLLVLARHG